MSSTAVRQKKDEGERGEGSWESGDSSHAGLTAGNMPVARQH